MMSYIVIVVRRAQRSDRDSLRKHLPGGIPGIGSAAARTLVAFLLTLTAGSSALAQERQEPVKIGVLAKRGPERCLEKWGPTAEYLTSEIPGYTFTIVPLGYDEVDPAAAQGDVDFVLANPSLYVGLERLLGARRIATLQNRPMSETYTVYGGVIFRRADRDDIKKLGDLMGKSFMAVHEKSFGGWQTGSRELKEHGIDPHRDFADLRFGGTHDAVVYAVRDGKVDAGTVRTETLERMAHEGKIRLDSYHVFDYDHAGKGACYYPFLHSTDTYPEWPFAEVKHTSHNLAEKVAHALLHMPADSPAAKAAKCAGWTVSLNYQPVHECLKELRVGPYAGYGKIASGDVLKRYRSWIVAAGALLAMTVITTLYVLRLNRRLSRSRSDLSQELNERWRAEEARAKAHRNLDERVKELTCTYAIVQSVRERRTLEEVFLDAARLMPSAWQHPDIARAKVRFEGKEFVSGPFEETEWKQTSDIVVGGERRGSVEVYYVQQRPDQDEGPFMDEERRLIDGIAHTLSEAIERSRAEEALRESEERLRLALSAAEMGTWRWDARANRDTRDASFNRILGLKAADSTQPVEGFLEHVHCDDRLSVEGEIQSSVREHRPYAAEFRIVRPDGEVRWLRDQGKGFYDNNGEFTHMTGAVVDITERKRAEGRLQESEERVRLLLDSTAEAIYGLDLQGNCIFCNPACLQVLGYSDEADVLGKNMHDLIHYTRLDGTHYPVHECRIFEAFQKGEGTHVDDEVLWRADGSSFAVEYWSYPVRKAGQLVGAVVTFLDITERKQAEEELERLHGELLLASRQAGMAEVATGVLHNVGNVLTSVNVSAEVIAEKMHKSRVANLGKAIELMSEHAHDLPAYISQDERGKQLPGYLSVLAEHLAAEQVSIIGELGVITDGVEHIKTIVAMQQSYTGASGIWQSMALSDVLDDVLKLDASSLAQHDIEVTRDYEEVPPVVTDKHKLIQIFMNLLKNAKHALIHDDGQPRRLTVRLGSSVEDRVRIEVIDNGVGIPPENLARIFEYGFTTKNTGHGFGLHSSALAATELSGSLTVHSDGPGKGATFTLELPVQPARTGHGLSFAI